MKQQELRSGQISRTYEAAAKPAGNQESILSSCTATRQQKVRDFHASFILLSPPAEDSKQQGLSSTNSSRASGGPKPLE